MKLNYSVYSTSFLTTSFQVEYLYYSTVDDPKYDVDEAEDSLIGNNGHFLKIEESAMCKVGLNGGKLKEWLVYRVIALLSN